MRATAKAIQNFISMYTKEDNNGKYIPINYAPEVMQTVMENFSSVYCGTKLVNGFNMLVVGSDKTNKKYCHMIIRDSDSTKVSLLDYRIPRI